MCFYVAMKTIITGMQRSSVRRHVKHLLGVQQLCNVRYVFQIVSKMQHKMQMQLHMVSKWETVIVGKLLWFKKSKPIEDMLLKGK